MTEMQEESFTRSKGRSVADLMASFMGLHEWVCLTFAIFVLAVGRLRTSYSKPLWFDEFFTLNLATLPTWAQFRQGLPVDANPPLLALLDHVMVRFFGVTAFAVRLPSLVAYLGTLVLIYLFMRRRVDVVFALLAVALASATPLSNYGIEARPYALVAFFTTLGLVAWQAATDEVHPARWAIGLLPVSIAGAVLSHHYGIVNVGIPLLCGELVRTWKSRRIDFVLWGAAAAGVLPLLVTLPMAHRTQAALLSYVVSGGHLSFRVFKNDYTRMFPSWLSLVLKFVVVALLSVYARGTGERRQRSERQWPLQEVAAMVGSSATLFIIWVLLHFTTPYYAGIRYGIGTTVGVSLLIAAICAKPTRTARTVALILAGVLVTTGAEQQPTAEFVNSALIESVPSHEPIVISAALLYPQFWWYADPALRSRIHFLGDLTYARHEYFNIPEVSLMLQRQLLPMKVDNYEDFVTGHRSFLLYTNDDGWQDYVKDHLLKDGFSLQLVASNLFLGRVARLYEVEAPPRSVISAPAR